VAIESLQCHNSRDALWCAFSRLIITKQSGASRAMDLSHSRPHRAFDVAPKKPFHQFLLSVERVIINCIHKSILNRGPQPTIKLGDARELALYDRSVDLVLTSPPYLNAIDYIRCSKFSLVWIGYNVNDLRDLRAQMVGTEASQEPSLADDKEIESVIEALKLQPKLEKRNERILRKYIYDMRKAIYEVRRVLSWTGKAVYVVGENSLRGTYIRTSVIISKLAGFAGLSMMGRMTRTLPANRRYLPPPSFGQRGGTMEGRMRREVVLTFGR